MRTSIVRVAVVTMTALAVVGLGARAGLGAVTLTPVGTLGGATSNAKGVSYDGTIVVGSAQDGDGNTQGYIWNGGVMNGLGFPGGLWYSSASAVDVASDGTVYVAVNGQNDYSPYPSEYQAYLWAGDAAGSGAYTWDLILFSDGFATEAYDLNVMGGDEVYVCGIGKRIDWVSASYYHGFRYRTQPSMLDLGSATGSTYPVYANSLSKFGQIAGQLQYGAGTPGSGARHAFWWESGNFTVCPTLKGPATNSNESSGKAIAADGSAVVGWSDPVTGYREAFVWTRGAATATEIGYLDGDDWSEASATNGYGTLVGGFSQSTTGAPKKAFIWDATNGIRDLATEVLTPAGVDLTGWTLAEVTGMSMDGSVLVGNGTYNGNAAGWIVTGMPAFPPPAPAIASVLPDPTATNVGSEYKVQLTLTQGTLPAPTWSVVTGPTGLSVNNSGLVYGWTPGSADLNTTVTITIRATNASGSGDVTWHVLVLNTGPTVNPVLYPNTTSVTVSGLDTTGSLTKVTLYRDRYNSGTAAWEETVLAFADASSTPPLNPASSTYTFTLNPGDLQVNDVIKATQTRSTIESEYGFKWRIVVQAIPSPQTPPHTFWGFSEDFELPYVQPYWQPEEMMTLTSAQSRGTQSLLEDAVSGGRLAWDAAPGNYDGATIDRNPVVFEFWMYEDGNGYARHVGGMQECSTGGYNLGTIKWLFETGLLPGIRTPSKGPADPTKYQYRCTQSSPSRNVSGDMDQAGCPGRSPGWHRFTVKIGATKVFWYVDGKLGHREINTNPAITCAYLGTWSGNTGVVNVATGVDVTLDGHTAYYDDVSLRQIVNNVPTLSIAQSDAAPGPTTTIDVTENKPFSYTVTATDPDTSDLTTLAITNAASLPAWLTRTPGDTATGSPTAGIALGGTPPAGSAGTSVTITFKSNDDLPLSNRYATLVLNITGKQCHTPPQDTDGDGDVDLADFGVFQSCFNGPNRPYALPVGFDNDCKCLDVDPAPNGDGDLDLADFGKFQSCFNGPNRPPAAGCGT
jgi:probable HAF family extracellular repeat protein